MFDLIVKLGCQVLSLYKWHFNQLIFALFDCKSLFEWRSDLIENRELVFVILSKFKFESVLFLVGTKPFQCVHYRRGLITENSLNVGCLVGLIEVVQSPVSNNQDSLRVALAHSTCLWGMALTHKNVWVNELFKHFVARYVVLDQTINSLVNFLGTNHSFNLLF